MIEPDAAYTIGTGGTASVAIPANDTAVTNLANAGQGSLRQAITNANAFAGSDTVTFLPPGAVGTIVLQSALPALAEDVAIENDQPGTAASPSPATPVRRPSASSRSPSMLPLISSLSPSPVARPPPARTVAASSTEAPLSCATPSSLTIPPLRPAAAAIYNTGTLIVTNTTISGNRGDLEGGALANVGGIAQIEFSALVLNTSANSPGIGSLDDSTTSTVVYNSIVSDSRSDGGQSREVQLIPGGFTPINSFNSLGYNLVGLGDGIGAFNQTGDLPGNTSPLLEPLADNGGLVQTHSIISNSNALDAGDPALHRTPHGCPRPRLCPDPGRRRRFDGHHRHRGARKPRSERRYHRHPRCRWHPHRARVGRWKLRRRPDLHDRFDEPPYRRSWERPPRHRTGVVEVDANTVDVPIASITSLAIDTVDGTDTVNFNASLSGVSLVADSDTIIVGNNASIDATGTQGVAITARTRFEMSPGTALTAIDGDITVDANQDGDRGGAFNGIALFNATIRTTVTGDIALTGTGGDQPAASNNRGIFLRSGGVARSRPGRSDHVRSAAAGSGRITTGASISPMAPPSSVLPGLSP